MLTVKSEPWWRKFVKQYGILAFAALYLLSPIDVIPDVSVPILEQLDDIIVLILSFLIQRHLARRDKTPHAPE